MALQLKGRIAANDVWLDTDLRDLQIVSGPSGMFLYAGTGVNGGISTYSLDAAGALASLSDSTYFTGLGLGVGQLDVITLDGETQLILNGIGSGGLMRYGIDATGDLTSSGQIALPGGGRDIPTAVATADIGTGINALYMVDKITGTVNGWLSDGQGALINQIALTGPAGAFVLTGVASLQTVTVEGNTFVLAANTGFQGISYYRVVPGTGALQAMGSLGADNGLGIAGPSAMEVVNANGTTWVVLAASGSGSLSVMRLTSDGQLIPADHVLDTLATRFSGVSALEVLEVDGHVFVLAGGADDGLSLFAILPDGRLVHMQTLVHAQGLGLENITGIEAVQIGAEIQIFVTSGSAAGISQFSLPLEDLGAVIQGTQGGSGGGQVLGTEACDLLVGGGQGGQDLLMGQGGDDILVSSQTGGVLTGGDGADTFVLCATTGTLEVTDFEPGLDQLDLSQLPMLRSLSQLDLQSIPTGIVISYETTTIRVHSRAGSTLTAADIWPNGFVTPDRMPSPADAGIRYSYGTRAADTLILNAGQDTVWAMEGNDLIRSGDDHDTVFGDAGADTIYGGSGKDTLRGGVGKDKLLGGSGRDKLFGGAGKDVLLGGGGKDKLSGGKGDDKMTGGAGADTFIFGGGAGHGADRITDFEPGLDHIQITLTGVGMNDLVVTSQGDDTLIDTSGGSILLTGVLIDSLSQDDFLFA